MTREDETDSAQGPNLEFKTGCQKKQLKLHVDQNIRAGSYSAPHALTSRHLVTELRK